MKMRLNTIFAGLTLLALSCSAFAGGNQIPTPNFVIPQKDGYQKISSDQTEYTQVLRLIQQSKLKVDADSQLSKSIVELAPDKYSPDGTIQVVSEYFNINGTGFVFPHGTYYSVSPEQDFESGEVLSDGLRLTQCISDKDVVALLTGRASATGASGSSDIDQAASLTTAAQPLTGGSLLENAIGAVGIAIASRLWGAKTEAERAIPNEENCKDVRSYWMLSPRRQFLSDHYLVTRFIDMKTGKPVLTVGNSLPQMVFTDLDKAALMAAQINTIKQIVAPVSQK